MGRDKTPLIEQLDTEIYVFLLFCIFYMYFHWNGWLYDKKLYKKI